MWRRARAVVTSLVVAAMVVIGLTVATAPASAAAVPTLTSTTTGVGTSALTPGTTTVSITTQPVISGTGTPGDMITLSALNSAGNTLNLCTTQVGGGGAWTCTSAVLPSGIYSIYANDTTAKVQSLAATLDIETGVSQTQSSVAVLDSAVQADGASVIHVAVQILGANGGTIPSGTPGLTVNPSNLPAGVSASTPVWNSITNSYNFTLTAQPTKSGVQGQVGATVVMGGLSSSVNPTNFKFTPNNANRTNVSVDDAQARATDGSSFHRVTVTLQNANGTPTPGPVTVYFFTTSGSTLSASQMAINSNGQAFTNVTSTAGGWVPVTAALVPDGSQVLGTIYAAFGGTVPTPPSVGTATPNSVSGTGTAGDTIKVTDSSGIVASTIVKADGTWTVTPINTLPAGDLLQITQSSPQNVASQPTSATVVSTGPVDQNTLSLANLATSYTYGQAPITIQTGGGSGTGAVSYASSNPQVGSVANNGNGTATVTFNQAGQFNVTATKAADSTYNQASATTTVTVAQATPNVTITQTPAGAGQVILTATVSPVGTGITPQGSIVFSNGATVPLASDGTATTVVSIPANGNVSYTASYSGQAPYYNANSGNYTLSAALPAPQVNPTDGSVVSGSATAGATVTVYAPDGKTVLCQTTVNSSGQWSCVPSPTPAAGQTLLVTASNAAGSSPATPVTVRPTAPAITSPANGSTITNPTQPITGQGVNGATVTVYDNGNPIGTTTVSGGQWSLTPTTPLSNGQHTLTASQALGSNASATSSPVTVTVNTNVSVPTINQPTNGLVTNNANVAVKGTGIVGDTITLMNGNATVASGIPVASDGSWTYTPPSGFTDGTYTFTATQKDASGNTSPVSNAVTVTIKTKADNPPVITSGNQTTTNPQPVITGTGVVGDVVTVTSTTGVNLGSVTVGSNGSWSLTSQASLAIGTYTVSATQKDAAGNTSGESNRVTVTVTSPVAAPVVSSPNSGATISQTPTISGTGVAGDTVTVLDGQTVLGAVKVGSDNLWSYAVPKSNPLNAGSHVFSATQSDGTNNSPASNLVPVTVKAADAAPTITSPTNGATVSATPSVSGTGVPGDTITVYADNSTKLGNATVGSNSLWTLATPSVSLPAGQHVLTATQTDGVGNVSNPSPGVQVNVVTAKPNAPTVNPSDGTVVSGTAEPGSTVKVKDPAGNVLCQTTADASTGAFTCSPLVPTPGNGTTLQVTATNPAGEGPSAPVTVNSGTKIAAPVISAPTSGSTIPQTPTITGSGVPGDTVTIYDGTIVLGTAVVGNNNLWTYTVSDGQALTAGSHVFTAKQSDGTSMSDASNQVAVTVKAADAAPTITSPTSGSTVPVKPAISGTGVPGDTVTVYADGNTTMGTTTVGSNSLWTLATPSVSLSAGSHTLTAKQADSVGNVSKASPGVQVTVVTSQPSAPIVNPTDGSIVSGTAEPGSTVKVKGPDGTTVLCQATADATTGAFSCSPVPTPGNGTQLSVTASNAAGEGPATPVTVNSAPKVAAPVISSPTTSSTVGQTPTISGSGVAGDTVTVYDGSVTLGQATVGSNNLWSYTVTDGQALTAGSHAFTAKQTDGTSVSDASNQVAVTVKAADAAPTITSPQNGATVSALPTVSGTGVPGDTVTVYADGNINLGKATVGSNSLWTLTTPTTALNAGSHVLTAKQADSVGNVSQASPGVQVNVVTAVPATPNVNPSDGSGVSGTAEPGSTVKVKDPAGNVLCQTTADASTGAFSCSPLVPAPADGSQLSVTASNPAGEGPAATVTVTPKVAAPVISTPSSGSTVGQTPTITGTGIVGATVTLLDGSTYLGQATVGQNGQWSYQVPSSQPLTAGSHQFSATQKDASGNGSAKSNVVAVTVKAKDAAPTITSPVNGATVSPTPSISGTGTPGDTVTVYADTTTTLGTATVGNNSQWTLVTPTVSLSAGSHSLTAKQADTVGNVSDASPAVQVTVISQKPVAPKVDPTNGKNVTGTAEPGSTVTVKDPAGNVLCQSTADATTGAFTCGPLVPTPGNGSQLAVTATNPAGEGPAATVTVNSAIPNPPVISSPIANTTVLPTQTISGTATSGNTVTVYDGSVKMGIATVTNGSWTYTPTSALQAGSHVFIAKQADSLGNESQPSAAVPVTVINSAPPAPTVNPSNGSVITGTAEPGSKVTVKDPAGNVLCSTTAAAGSGLYACTPIPTPGDGTTLQVTASNAVGTSDPTPVTVKKDGTTVPVPVIANPKAGATVSTTPVISGSGIPGDTVAIYDGGVSGTSGPSGTKLGTAVVGSNQQWSFTVPSNAALAVGAHSFTATQTDTLGNSSVASAAVPVTVSNAVPAPPTVNPTNGTKVSGTGTPGNTIAVTDTTSGNPVGTATVDGNGNWALTPSSPLPNGDVLSVTQATPAGAVSQPVTVVVDAVRPAPPVVDPTNGGTVSGTAEPGSTVNVKDPNGNQLCTTTADATTGAFSCTPVPTPGGGTEISVTATDPSGNTSDPTKVTVDSTLPAAPVITAPTAGTVVSPTVTITGTAVSGNTVVVYDGATKLGTATVGANNMWSYAIPASSPLTVGSHSFTATQSNPQGKVSNHSAAVPVTVTQSVAPVAPVITSPVSGTTMTPQQVIKGTGVTGDTVTVYDGSNALGTAPVTGGQWSFTPTSPLPAGQHTLTAKQADTTGVTSTASNAVQVTVVTSAPNMPQVNPSDGSVISGTAQPGSTVTVKDPAGNVLCTAVAAAGTGAFACTPIPTPGDGTTLAVTATNAAGTSPAANVTISATTKPAAPVITAPANGDVVSPTPLITGTGVAGNTVTVLDGSNPGTVLGTTVVGSNNLWSFTPTAALPSGTHTFTATQTSAVGNASPASNAVTVTVNPSVPAPPTVDPTNGTKVSGTGVPGNTITVKDTTTGQPVGTATVDANGKWTVTPSKPLPNGDVLSVTQTNPLGTVSQPVLVTVDSIPPAPPVVYPTDGTTVSGTAEPGSTVTVTDPNGNTLCTAAAASGTGSYSCVPVPTPGNGTQVSVTATDPSGNSSLPTTVTVNSALPDAPVIASPIAGTVVPATQVVSGTGVAGNTVTVYDGTVRLGTAQVGPNNTWSFTPGSPLTVGSHSFTATQTDGQGRVSNPSAAVPVTVAPIPASPAPVITSPRTGLSVSSTPTITGTGVAGNTVNVYDGSNKIGVATVGQDGKWSYTVPGGQALGAGSHTLTATQTNASGKESVASSPVQVNVVTKAPFAPVVNPSDGSTVTGSAEPGSTVTVKDPAGNVLCTATADATGAFACTPVPTPGNGTTLGVTATNPAGTSPTSNVTVNSTAPLPAPVITAPANGSVVSTTPWISGTGIAGDTVTVLDGSNPGTVLGTAVVGPNNLWSFTPSPALSVGSHTFTATQANTVGNTSPASNAVTVTVNASVPAPPTVNPTDGTKVSGTGAPGNTVTVIDQTTGKPVGTVTVDGSGKWTVTPSAPLPNGDVLSVTQTNPSGVSSQPVTVVVDSVPPAPPVVYPSDGSSVSGTGEPGSQVTVKDPNGNVLCTTTADPVTGTFSCQPVPTPGDGTQVSVTATDPSGNTSDPTTVTVNKVLPKAPVIASPIAGTVVPATQVVSGTGVAGNTVTVYDGTVRLGTAQVGPNNTWSFTPGSPLTVGSHSFTATQTDGQGRVSNPSAAVPVTVAPTAAPTAPVVKPTHGVTVSGTAQPGSTIKVTKPDGTVVGTGTTDQNGAFVVTLNPNQPVGTELSVTATDPVSGKVSPATKVTVLPSIAMSRIQGPDRYSTAVAASQQQYPNGAQTVFVARGTNYPDAISAGPAAVKLNAPILLTQPTTLTGVTLQEINRLHPTKIIVLGDEVSVSAPVFNQLKSWMGSRGQVVRLAGPDRYATNRALVSYVWGASAPTVVATTGQNFTDAEAASAAAAKLNVPVVLVNGNAAGLDAATSALLRKMGTSTVHAVGSTTNLNPLVYSGLSSFASTDRTEGDDPTTTSIAVAQKFFPQAKQVYIATSDDFPDALVAGALAGKNGAPVVFTVNTLSPGIADEIISLAATQVYVMGDNTRITDTAYNNLATQLGITG